LEYISTADDNSAMPNEIIFCNG